MTDTDEGFVVVVTEEPIDPYEGCTVVVFKGQTEHNDEMVEVTFGVDQETAAAIVEQLADDHAHEQLSEGDEQAVMYAMVLVEPWQVLSMVVPNG